MALDESYVFWTNNNDGTIKAVSVNGGAVRTLASGQSWPTDITTMGSNVYWTDMASGKVIRMPKTGGIPTELASGQQRPYAIVANAQGVFWTTSNGLMFLPASGGTPKHVSSGTPAWKVTIHENQVFWTQGTQKSGGLCDGFVFRAAEPYSASGKTELASAQCGPFGLAVDDTSVYWTNHGGDAVLRRGISAGGITRISSGDIVGDIAVDDTNVYWITQDGVLGAPKAGGKSFKVIE